MPNRQPLAVLEATLRAPGEALRQGVNQVGISLGLAELPPPPMFFAAAPGEPEPMRGMFVGRPFADVDGLEPGLPFTAGVESGDRPRSERVPGVNGTF